jgi:hypothetical protein
VQLVNGTAAPFFTVSPQAPPTAVSWDASYALPDLGTDSLFFTVADTFTVSSVNLWLHNFRHYRAPDMVVTLRRPGDDTEVFLINRPCSWIASGQRQTTFGVVRAVAPGQVNATSPGDTYFFGDFAATGNPPGSIQASLCPFNEPAINPIPGASTSGGNFQPMNGFYAGTLGIEVLGTYPANMPGSMSALAGGVAAGVWTLSFTDVTANCALAF